MNMRRYYIYTQPTALNTSLINEYQRDESNKIYVHTQTNVSCQLHYMNLYTRYHLSFVAT
jgi:hypothetical protein